MAPIIPSLQLAKTEVLTPYTYTYTFGRGSRILFFCIQHSSRGFILCRLASRAPSFGWLVGNNCWELRGGEGEEGEHIIILNIFNKIRTSLKNTSEYLPREILKSLIQDWIFYPETDFLFFSKQINPGFLGSRCVKGTEESALEMDQSSVPLKHYDPRDLGLICLVKKSKIRFGLFRI